MAVQTEVDTWLRQNNGGSFPLVSFFNNDGAVRGCFRTVSGQSGPMSRRIQIYDTISYVTATPKWEMDHGQWKRFWDFVENKTTYFTENTYPLVKENDDWKRLYEVGPRPVTYESPAGPIQQQVQETIACKRCKIVLPLAAITVDHERPQKGGSEDAIFKMFKAMGLTTPEHSPHGRKALFWGGANGVVTNFADQPSIGWFNWAGVLYYSLLTASKCRNSFGVACIHHAINLAPLCFQCNSKKGNWGYR